MKQLSHTNSTYLNILFKTSLISLNMLCRSRRFCPLIWITSSSTIKPNFRAGLPSSTAVTRIRPSLVCSNSIPVKYMLESMNPDNFLIYLFCTITKRNLNTWLKLTLIACKRKVTPIYCILFPKDIVLTWKNKTCHVWQIRCAETLPVPLYFIT